MSLYNFLMAQRTKEQLAKELAQSAKENAALKNRVHELEHTIFWLNAQPQENQMATPTDTERLHALINAALAEIKEELDGTPMTPAQRKLRCAIMGGPDDQTGFPTLEAVIAAIDRGLE